MEDRETPRMQKYGESKTTQIMMATVRHVTSRSGLRKFEADGFLFDWKISIFSNTVVRSSDLVRIFDVIYFCRYLTITYRNILRTNIDFVLIQNITYL